MPGAWWVAWSRWGLNIKKKKNPQHNICCTVLRAHIRTNAHVHPHIRLHCLHVHPVTTCAWLYSGEQVRADARVPFCHNRCRKCSHQLMWKSAEEKGIVLQLRQMLLLLSAFAFNLFFKPLEYPIYNPRLSELIFGLLPLKKRRFFLFRLKGEA